MAETNSAPTRDLSLEAIGLHIEGVEVSYGEHKVLNNINLNIKPGEFFALLGPSGCGKTTLLRLIAGFTQAGKGRVLVGDRDISHLPPWKRDVGMVFQSYALWPHMTVARNVAFGLEERRIAKSDITRRVTASLDLVGLAQLAERRPSQLSGGQQQRVALARTIAIEPKILLLDEPLSNLDAKMRVQVRRELRELQQRLGLTTILVTHDQEEANTICDRVAVINAGEVQQVGTPAALYEAPANLFVANFLGTANIITGRITGTDTSRAFEADGGLRIPVPPHAPIPGGAKMVFRPQDVIIVGDEETSPGPAIGGRISFREFLGASVRYGVRAGTTEIAVDAPFRTGDRLYDLEQPVKLSIAPGSIRWLTA
ncbi:MAG TPA: ABC transporter ATP-binding protein [Afipia sp.]